MAKRLQIIAEFEIIIVNWLVLPHLQPSIAMVRPGLGTANLLIETFPETFCIFVFGMIHMTS